MSFPASPATRIHDKIDSGGMGVVYKAVQHSLKRTVALKVLRSTAIENPQRWLRFKTETEAIGRLQHANIVRVFDAGEYAGRAYVSQELCDSESFAARMGTPQSPVEVAAIIQKLADAAHHAHGQDVLHRDIKPSNILFLDGNVKLVDFGLAKLTDVDDALTLNPRCDGIAVVHGSRTNASRPRRHWSSHRHLSAWHRDVRIAHRSRAVFWRIRPWNR